MSLKSSDIPTRSADGRAALDIFYTDFNDINFYVEDEDQENLYEEILRRLFPQVTISRIFPLGGKDAVLAHASSPSNANITSFRAYIVDKDFDDLLNGTITADNIFYLDRFCIENYFLEHPAILELVVENHPKKKKAEIEIALQLSETVPSIFSGLRDLFLLFYCVQHFDLGIKNCSFSPEAFCNNRSLWTINQTAMIDYKECVAKAAQEKGIQPPLTEPISDHRLAAASMASAHSLVSGKFAAAMLFHFTKSKYSLGSMTFDSFVYRLAKNCELRSLKPLARRIKSSAKAFEKQNSSRHRSAHE